MALLGRVRSRRNPADSRGDGAEQIRCRLAACEQLADVLLRATQGCRGGMRCRSRGLPGRRSPVPRGGGDTEEKPRQAHAAEVGARLAQRRRHRVLDLLLADQPLHPARSRELDGQALPSRTSSYSTSTRCSFASAQSRPSRSRYDSSSASLAAQSSSPERSIGRVPAGRARSPSGPGRRRSVVGTLLEDERESMREVLTLPVDRRHRATVGELDRLLQGTVVRTWCIAATGAAGVRPNRRYPASIIAGASDVVHAGVDRDLGAVGVTQDDVKASVLLDVGVRLVAGVDDRTLEVVSVRRRPRCSQRAGRSGTRGRCRPCLRPTRPAR